MKTPAIFKKAGLFAFALTLALLMALTATIAVFAADTVATVGGTAYTDIDEAVARAIERDEILTLSSDASIYVAPNKTIVVNKGGKALAANTKEGWDLAVLENHDGTVTVASYRDQGDKITAMKLRLDGSIIMMVYLKDMEVLQNNPNAYLEVKIPQRDETYKTVRYYYDDLTVDANDPSRFELQIRLAPAQQTEKVIFQVVNGDERGRLRQYSVRDYSNIILNDTVKYASSVEVVKAMLNYGGMAQDLFGYKEEAFANDGLYADGSNPVNGIAAADIKGNAPSSKPKVTNTGLSKVPTYEANLDSETGLIFYFYTDYSDEAIPPTVTVTPGDGDAYAVTPVYVAEKGAWKVEIAKIMATRLDIGFKITIKIPKDENTFYNVYSFERSVLSYIKDTIKSSTATTEQKNTAISLYNYYVELKGYIGSPVETTCSSHIEYTEITKAATCTENGTTVTKCTICGEQTATGTISKTGHTIVSRAAIAATCEASGVAAHYECTNCGVLFADKAGNTTTTLDALVTAATGHSDVVVGVWDASAKCYMSKTACTKCGNKYPVMGNINMTASVINAGHKNNVNTTLSADGKYVTYTRVAGQNDNYIAPYQNGGTTESGQYMIIKYRADAVYNKNIFAVYTSTTNSTWTGDDYKGYDLVVNDESSQGAWHYAIVDLGSHPKYTLESSVYSMNFFRIGKAADDTQSIDLAYIVVANDLGNLIDSVKTFDEDAKDLISENIGETCAHPDYAQGYVYKDKDTHVAACMLCGYVADGAATGAHSGDARDGVWSEADGYYVSANACTICNEYYAVDFAYTMDAERIVASYAVDGNTNLTNNSSYVTLTSRNAKGTWTWADFKPVNWSDNEHVANYAVVKYRAPAASHGDAIELAFSTRADASKASHKIYLRGDNKWHFAVVDLNASAPNNWFPGSDGKTHTITGFGIALTNVEKGHTVDIEYVKLATDLEYTRAVLAEESTTYCTHAHLINDICVGCGLDKESKEVVENANKHASNIDSYFTTRNKNIFTINNENMSFEYPLSGNLTQLPTAIKNAAGNKTYISNTMDVFLRMTDGTTVYGSKTSKTAKLNVFRFGYYYYEARVEGQNMANGIKQISSKSITPAAAAASGMTASSVSGGIALTITDTTDPWVRFSNTAYTADDYNYLRLTMKVEVSQGYERPSTIYFATTDGASIAYQTVKFDPIVDGQFHTYDICLTDNEAYSGKGISYLRLDVDEEKKGDVFTITELKLINADEIGAPDLTLSRNFHVYADKLHHELQLSTDNDVTGIEEIGLETKINASTVSKLYVKDASGAHDSLDDVDWTTAEYVAFDITDAGIFGYILPAGEVGTLKVTLANSVYTIIQSRAPENNTILAGDGANIGNDNDFYMGQRIYTDANHTFDKFIKEAEIERNPLTSANIEVVKENSDAGDFVGYDPIRGSYYFTLKGVGFNQAYFGTPNRHFRLNFKVTGDTLDRHIYVVAATTSGGLEHSVLLDENLMLLATPVQVGKNFGTDGDKTACDRLDVGYGETIIPLLVHPGETTEYNVLHLYQNWGRFPLKQLSSIEYHSPYYHISTGTSETNCIIPFGWTGNWNIKTMLPDHRPMSAPFWASQPQHAASGDHFFFYTRDEDGVDRATTNKGDHIDANGPTYFEIEMKHTVDNGDRIKITYTNIEMPQTDENRAYYTMEYEFLEDVTFNEFSRRTYFYAVAAREQAFTQYGYLDENNVCKVVTTDNTESNKLIVLGDKCPYFSFFNIPTPEGGFSDWNGSDYGNVSFLIKDSTIIHNGVEADYNFAIKKTGGRIYLTLNLTGDVTFKKGDKITINAIVMPWGSSASDYNVSDPDWNVRAVRENTLLNPIKATAANNETAVLESVWVPKVVTANGKTAEFTISGGKQIPYDRLKELKGGVEPKHNIAVRAYGFDSLVVPKVYMKDSTGAWQEYKLSSAEDRDQLGYGEHYDGYAVFRDPDGSYSYSFVVDMSDGVAKTFKIDIGDGVTECERITEEDKLNDLLVSFDSIDIGVKKYGGGYIKSEANPKGLFSSVEWMGYDGGEGFDFVRFTANPLAGDTAVTLMQYGHSGIVTSGQYFVIKYRTNAKNNTFQYVASTEHRSPVYTDVKDLSKNLYIADEEWHIVVIDLSKTIESYTPNEDGEYVAKIFRVDPFNFDVVNPTCDENDYIDIAYMGTAADLSAITMIDKTVSDVLVYDGESILVYDSATGTQKPGTTIPYHMVNIDTVNGLGATKRTIMDYYINSTDQIDVFTYTLKLKGWIITPAGVSEYRALVEADGVEDVWVTDITGMSDRTDLDSLIPESYNKELVIRNSGFNLPITIDPSAYHGKTVTITVYAVTYEDMTTVGGMVPIYQFSDAMPEHYGQKVTNNGDGTHTISCEHEGCTESIVEEHRSSGAFAKYDPTLKSYFAYCTLCGNFSSTDKRALMYTIDETNIAAHSNGSPGGQVYYTINDGYFTITDKDPASGWDGIDLKKSFPADLGPIFAIKYRVLSTSVLNKDTEIVIHPQINKNENSITLTADGEWHLAIVDWDKTGCTANEDGTYTVTDFWMMWWKEQNLTSIDIEFVGFGNSAAEINSSIGTGCEHPEGALDKSTATPLANNPAQHSVYCTACETTILLDHIMSDDNYAIWNAEHDNGDGTFGAYVEYCTVCNGTTANIRVANLFISGSDLIAYSTVNQSMSSAMTAAMSGDNAVFTNKNGGDAFIYILKDNTTYVTGQYFFIKCKASSADVCLQLFAASTSSSNTEAKGNGDSTVRYNKFTVDGWDYYYIDMSILSQFKAVDGKYSVKYFRFDIDYNAGDSLTVAYCGFADDLTNLQNSIRTYEGDQSITLKTTTAK